MEFSGIQTIAAPIEKVWAFLMDVNNVASCAPGFQSLEVLGEEHWKAVVACHPRRDARARAYVNQRTW